MLAQDSLCLAICAVATVTDVKSYRIPDWLTIGGICGGLALNTVLLDGGWLGALAGGLLCGLVFGLLGAVGFVGMGDVKLMIAVGTLVGLPVALYALVYVGLAGGLVALGYAVARGEIGDVLLNLGRMARGKVAKEASTAPVKLHRIPYASAILIGCVLAISTRYHPLLRL